jgi:hypothetical protein
MSDNNAARKGDEIIHSSIFADITSIVAEGAAYAVIGAAVAQLQRSRHCSGRWPQRAWRQWIQLSVKRDYRWRAGERGGITDDISNAAEGLGNALFPPSPAGKITTGSNNVLTNATRRARGRHADARRYAVP